MLSLNCNLKLAELTYFLFLVSLVSYTQTFLIFSVINRPPSMHQVFESSYYIQRDHSTPVKIDCKAHNGNIT